MDIYQIYLIIACVGIFAGGFGLGSYYGSNFKSGNRGVLSGEWEALQSIPATHWESLQAAPEKQQVAPEKQQVLVFNSYTAIFPGETRNVAVSPLTGAFQVNRLVISKDIASHFEVLDILVDGLSQLSGDGTPTAIPAVIFGDGDNIVGDISLDTIKANGWLEILVINKSDEPASFYGCARGRLVPQPVLVAS